MNVASLACANKNTPSQNMHVMKINVISWDLLNQEELGLVAFPLYTNLQISLKI